MEIGSVYEINRDSVLDIDDAGKLRLKEVEKYEKNNVVYTASGREAIALALRSINEVNSDKKKTCLMPAYMCDTVFIPFVQNGWDLCFYHVKPDMKVDIEELERLLHENQPDLLFIHPYYGIDTWKDFREWMAGYQKKGIIVMEDVTQSYYLDTHSQADYIVGSLRKWYAVPDGGFVASNENLNRERIERDDRFAMERLSMQVQKWNYLSAICDNGLSEEQKETLQKQKEEYLALNRVLEERLDHFDAITALSRASEILLRNVDEASCKTIRESNYKVLCRGLQKKKSVSLVNSCNDDGVAALYFPVYMKEREQLQEFLRQKDIYVPVLWPIGKENRKCLSKEEEYVYDHIAAIPMDQRYCKEDMERIVAAIEEYEESLL